MKKLSVLANKNIMGLIIAVLVTLIGFIMAGNIGMYFNLSGFLIVTGGSLGCALISYRLERLMVVYRVILASYRHRQKQPREIVEIMIDLAVKSRVSGILSLQEDERETSVLFLRGALGLLVDGRQPNEIQDILNSEMYFFKLRER
jgi:chemotaxis protein MotA